MSSVCSVGWQPASVRFRQTGLHGERSRFLHARFTAFLSVLGRGVLSSIERVGATVMMPAWWGNPPVTHLRKEQQINARLPEIA